MRTIRSILIHIGPHARGDFAVERAARLAAEGDFIVTIVVDGANHRDTTPLALERLAEPLVSRGIDVRIRVRADGRLQSLLREMDRVDADLVIKAADREDMAPAVLRKSFTQRLVRASRVPVWVVRLAPPHAPSRIVAILGHQPDDAHVHDARVLESARLLARFMSASLAVVTHDMLVADCGRATRLAVDSRGMLDATLEGIEAVGADLVVMAQVPQTNFLSGIADPVAGLLRHSHASFVTIPNPPPKGAIARKRSTGFVRDTALAGSIALALASGCQPPPPDIPVATTQPPATAPMPPSERPLPYAYAQSSICGNAEQGLSPFATAESRRSCCDSFRAPLLDPLGLADDAHLRVGHHESACGPAPIDVNLTRDPTSSPSESVRPSHPFYEMRY